MLFPESVESVVLGVSLVTAGMCCCSEPIFPLPGNPGGAGGTAACAFAAASFAMLAVYKFANFSEQLSMEDKIL